ncbi:hypothetical protein [uncultured Rhodoferax sp.]|uniref:hypothetical protein n=1 Tax=uncultured Rhodoferax sp. TaxID=223188 RepID=UPI0025EEFBEB|nr:hypothetical protein [uncultured Rhodoferax sp.]
MLKKDKPVKLANPVSTMRLVYDSILNGNHSVEAIRVDTKKLLGQVRSAIYNLSHIGMIKPVRVNGRTHWYLPGDVPAEPIKASGVFANCSSIFIVRDGV